MITPFRGGVAWAKYICEAITRYGDEMEITFQSYNWPLCGNDVANEYENALEGLNLQVRFFAIICSGYSSGWLYRCRRQACSLCQMKG